MSTSTLPLPGFSPRANDRLKRRSTDWFWGGLLLATLLHFALLALWPEMEAADVGFTSETIEQVEVVQEFEVPPPPTGQGVDVSEQPTFTPYEVKPDFRDRAAFARLVVRSYPPMLRDAGIGGTVILWVFIDEQGRVRNTRVVEGSGYEQFDRVASEVIAQAGFTPALNRDRRVPVWIQIPVTFQSR